MDLNALLANLYKNAGQPAAPMSPTGAVVQPPLQSNVDYSTYGQTGSANPGEATFYGRTANGQMAPLAALAGLGAPKNWNPSTNPYLPPPGASPPPPPGSPPPPPPPGGGSAGAKYGYKNISKLTNKATNRGLTLPTVPTGMPGLDDKQAWKTWMGSNVAAVNTYGDALRALLGVGGGGGGGGHFPSPPVSPPPATGGATQTPPTQIPPPPTSPPPPTPTRQTGVGSIIDKYGYDPRVGMQMFYQMGEDPLTGQMVEPNSFQQILHTIDRPYQDYITKSWKNAQSFIGGSNDTVKWNQMPDLGGFKNYGGSK